MTKVRDFQVLLEETTAHDQVVHVAIVAKNEAGFQTVGVRDVMPFKHAADKLVDLFKVRNEPDFACATLVQFDDAAVFAVMDGTTVIVLPAADAADVPTGLGGELETGCIKLDERLPENVVATFMRRT